MAGKIRLGETTLSGRLVRDPVDVKSRAGRQMKVFRVTRIQDQAGSDVQDQGLEEVDIAFPPDKIPPSVGVWLESGDLVTVRGESVIATVKNQEGGVELRQRMLAKQITVALAASVAYSQRPIPWHVYELDEDGRHRVHIPVEELEKDPELVKELVEYRAVEEYPFTDEILEKRRKEFASDLEAAESVSRQYSPAELTADLWRDRYRRTCRMVGAEIAKLPDGALSIVPEHERETWEKTVEAEAERIGFPQDHFVVQLEVGDAIAWNYGPQEVGTWVDQYRQQASSGQRAGTNLSAQKIGRDPVQRGQGPDADHVMMQQANTLPARPGAQGPGL